MQEHLILKEESYKEMMESTVEPYLKERGQELFYEREKGKKIHCVKYQADRPKGVLLISHGFTESAEKYKEVIYYFLKEQYHVYIPEHCGHGKSGRLTEDMSLVHVDHFERYVADLLFAASQARMENEGLPLFLYAHSMGGGVGAAAAARRPELFQKIVLTSPMIRPLTGNIPWSLAQMMAAVMCLAGKKMAYVNGHPYDGKENFEESSSASPERFAYYQAKRKVHRELQTNAASYGWLREAGKLNRYLRNTAVKRIKCPVILFQAQQETLVSEKEQRRFMRKLSSWGAETETVQIKGAKHEIYNAQSAVLEKYWSKIFDFLE